MEISGINIYPIKSLKGIRLDRAIVENRGLKNDRRFMLIDVNNDLVTQREIHSLAMVYTRFVEKILEMSFDKERWFRIRDYFFENETIEVRVWNSFCDALVADDEINSLFSKRFETDLRLVRMPSATSRRINEAFNAGDDIVSFADGYPLLLIGESSLNDLNSRLEEEILMDRFRPNLVVSGFEPFAEDSWKKIRVGNTIFRVTKPCARCVVTTIDQSTGVSDVKEPLKTLATYRKSSDVFPNDIENFGLGKNDILFGQNLVAENFGEEIKLGDHVEVLESN